MLGSAADDQLFDQVDVPTLVLYRRDHVLAPPEAVRLAVSRLRRVSVVELRGADLFPFLGDVDSVVSEISNFVVGERRTPPPQPR